MSQDPIPKPVRRALAALVVTAAAGLLLASYAAWAAVTMPTRTDAFLAALTAAQRDTLADDAQAAARTAQAALPFHLVLGLVAIAVSVIAIPLRQRYDRARTVLWWVGSVVAFAAVIFMIGGADVNTSLSPNGVSLTTAEAKALPSLVPPGFVAVDYLSLAAIAVSLGIACISLMHPDSHWYLTRGRETSTDPRWTATP
jgi:hypothetical protein